MLDTLFPHRILVSPIRRMLFVELYVEFLVPDTNYMKVRAYVYISKYERMYVRTGNDVC